MEFDFDPGALLASSYVLADGTRVRLRLVAGSDLGRITALLTALGHDAPALEAVRLTRFDPRRRLVLCATGLIDGVERLIGLGAIDLERGDGRADVDTVWVAPEAPQGLADLLAGALVGRARVLARRHAA